jgi:hypothetical protein
MATRWAALAAALEALKARISINADNTLILHIVNYPPAVLPGVVIATAIL